MNPREMSIEAALQWAFGVECAALDFDEMRGDDHRPGISTIWQIAERGRLGCSIDGGGRSLPAHDADIIASAVASLPPGYHGKAMAVEIARLARSGLRPDWMQDSRMRMVPKAWRMTKHGEFAATAPAEGPAGDWVWQRRGRRLSHRGVCCPVRLTPTASQVAAARRAWLDWWGALLWLQAGLRVTGALDTIRITRAMPPMTPWRHQAESGTAKAA